MPCTLRSRFEVVRTVTGGLTSPARLAPVERIQGTKSGILPTVSPSQGEAPPEPPNAGPGYERLPAFLRSSGDRRNPRGRDAAQPELRPPGTPSCQKVRAIGRQPAGKRPCQHPTNALASARTFGAKHSRGLPPNRWSAAIPNATSAAWWQPAGKTPLPTPLPTRSPARAPSVRNTAGGFRPTAKYGRNLSRMAAACGQTGLQTPAEAPLEALLFRSLPHATSLAVKLQAELRHPICPFSRRFMTLV